MTFCAYTSLPKNMSALLNDRPRYPASWDFKQPTGYLATPAEALTPMVTPEAGPSTSLGKRCRQRYETYSYSCLAGSRQEQRRRQRTRRPREEGQAKYEQGPGGDGVHEEDSTFPYHEDPNIRKWYIQGGGTRSGEARVHDSAGSIPSTNAGTSCPAGVGGSP